MVDLSATFENQSLVLQVVLTESLQVSGFFLRPAEPPTYDPPSYVVEDLFEEIEITVGADPWLLPGVLTLPKNEGPVPVIVLVHGSGPNDRDETIGGSRPFRDLAWGLASRGIAVLRYDKRTKVHGASLPADIGLGEEVVLDALSALDVARNRPEVDSNRVFLLGAPPPYWQEVAEVYPVAVAKELSTPVMALQGGRDYQSTVEDLSLWEVGLGEKEGFASKLYPALNHLFAPGTGPATPEEYVSEASHVADEVILDLASWIQGIGG